MHVKKGDLVQVISGNDRGRSGEVRMAFPKQERVLVEGINMRWRHKKPTQQNPKGERLQVELPIHVSNVKLQTATAKKTKQKATKAKQKAE